MRLKFTPFVLLTAASLLIGLWAGLVRMGWLWPFNTSNVIIAHGPLMITGFLGTLVALERSVALDQRWTLAGPLLSGFGALLVLFQLPGGQLLITLASLSLTLVFVVIIKRHPALHTVVMGLGALVWLVGNIVWLAGAQIYTIVQWWMAFLVFTIAGERLELSRVRKLPKLAHYLFTLIIVGMLISLILIHVQSDVGIRLLGAGYLILSIWLFQFDIARFTVRRENLTRYVAVCLLSGYIWLAVGGGLMIFSGQVVAGLVYDAVLHTILVGFVMAMIFGHAPIILPALLNTTINFKRVVYFPLGLLHLSLIMRICGDLLTYPLLRRWGGLLNAVAILVFLGITGTMIERQARTGNATESEGQ